MMNIGDTLLSTYQDAYDMKHNTSLCLRDIAEAIKTQRYHDRIFWLRDANKGKIAETQSMSYQDRHDFYKDKRRRRLPIFFPVGIVDRASKPIKVIQPAHLLCLDIDRKENICCNFDWLKAFCQKANQYPNGWNYVPQDVAKLASSVILISTSTSGDGVFMLMQYQGETVVDRNRAYNYAVEKFKSIGINADDGAKSPRQFRYFSCDLNIYVNWDAAPVKVPDDWQQASTQSILISAAPAVTPKAEIRQKMPKFNACTKTLQKKLEGVLLYVLENKIDITKSATDWKKLKVSIRCAEIARAVDNGLALFWTLSQFYKKPSTGQMASYEENKDYYNQPLAQLTALKIPTNYPPATLNALWAICRKYQIPNV